MKTIPETDEEIEKFNLFADELEYEWKKTLPRYTERELVEVFSPPKEMIEQKIKDWEAWRLDAIRNLKLILKSVYRIETDEFTHWFGAFVARLYLQPEIEEGSRHIKRLKRTLNILTPETTATARTDSVERARSYPIHEIARGSLQLTGAGNKYRSLCPFHSEKHASFYLYPETNTFHCFGCQEHGDVITLTMHLHGASFPEAVAMLQR